MSSREVIKINHCIIGGGILGLFTAFELVKAGEKDIVLLEASPYLGDQTTGRNSCVLHAGIYYPKNSLKHLTCIEGVKLWNQYSKDYKFPLMICGKYIIATTANEEEQLEKVFEQAKENGVANITRSSKIETAGISEYINVHSAIFSAGTGIIDAPTTIKLLENFLESHGVIIMKSHHVKEIRQEDKFILPFADFEIHTTHLYNHAGLSSVHIRKKLGLNDLENKFVKGNYVKTSQKLDYKHLFYPVPEKNLKGLGVHSTIDFMGDVRFGPNTEDITEVNYQLNQENLKPMTESIQKVFKNIDESKLYLDYCGIRPKIIKDGQLYTDFWIESPLPNYYETCGIESPGLTAAPAIAQKIVSMVSLS